MRQNNQQTKTQIDFIDQVKAEVSKPLKIFCFSDGDELWADYSLEQAKENFKNFCGLTDDQVDDAYELEETLYDELKITFVEDDPPHQKEEKISYKEYLKEFTEPNYFAVSADLY
jgi:hypothetical protein